MSVRKCSRDKSAPKQSALESVFTLFQKAYAATLPTLAMSCITNKYKFDPKCECRKTKTCFRPEVDAKMKNNLGVKNILSLTHGTIPASSPKDTEKIYNTSQKEFIKQTQSLNQELNKRGKSLNRKRKMNFLRKVMQSYPYGKDQQLWSKLYGKDNYQKGQKLQKKQFAHAKTQVTDSLAEMDKWIDLGIKKKTLIFKEDSYFYKSKNLGLSKDQIQSNFKQNPPLYQKFKDQLLKLKN